MSDIMVYTKEEREAIMGVVYGDSKYTKQSVATPPSVKEKVAELAQAGRGYSQDGPMPLPHPVVNKKGVGTEDNNAATPDNNENAIRNFQEAPNLTLTLAQKLQMQKSHTHTYSAAPTLKAPGSAGAA